MRSRRWLAWVLVLGLAVRAALPWAVELGAESFGSGLFGRRVEIGNVDLALLAGGVIVERVAVGPLGRVGEPPPEFVEGEGHFTLARLSANLGWLALLGGELHVERVELVEPGWLMLRDASGQLVPVLLPREASAEDGEPEEASGPGLPIRLDVLTLKKLDSRFINMARPEALPLHFELEELRVEGLERRGDQLAVSGIGLKAPSLRVLRDIDLSFVGGEAAAEAEAASGAEAAAAEAAPVAPLRLRLAEVDIETASFLLVTQEGELATRLAFHAEGVTLEPGESFPIRTTVGLEEGELVLEGEAGAFPPTFAGTLTWQALPLTTLAGAAGELSPVRVDAGTSSGELRIDVRVDDEQSSQIGVSGRLGVASLALQDRSGDLALGWSDLEVGLEELALDPAGQAPPRVVLSQVALAAPRVRMVRRAGAAPEAASPPAGEPDAEPTPAAQEPVAAPRPELSLARLVLTGGELEFVDETVKPAHRSRVVDLEVKGAGLRWPAQEAESLTVSFAGPAEARFALDAAISGSQGRAHVELTRLGLPAFSPYAAEAAGYWLEQGQLSVEADVAVDGSRTELDSDLDLYDLAMSEVEPGSFEKQFGIPIGVGLALLRDPFGRIGLPIRATLGEDGASVGVTTILVSALRQAILGALTAPLKTAGLLLPGKDGPSGMKLEPVAMAAGSSVPAPEDLSALVRFSGVLESRPGLALELHGALAPEDDPMLAEQILQEQVVADAELPPVEAGFLQRRRLRGALEERAEGGQGKLEREDSEALQRWIAAVDVPDLRREQLANARAEAVRDALVREHGVAAERIQVGPPTEGAPGVVVSLAPAQQ